MTRTRLFVGTMAVALLGCVDRSADDDLGGVSATGVATTVGSESGTSVEPTAGSTGTSGGTTGSLVNEESTGKSGSSFLIVPDGGTTISNECDLYEQDCGAGQKCSVWAAGGSSVWDATQCVEVTGDRQPGETCTAVGGGITGADDCEKGAMCWDVDPMTNMGVCIAFCAGSFEMATCEAGAVCIYGRLFDLCIPTCDPLVQDCPEDQVCVPNVSEFHCEYDGSGELGATNDPCEYINSCDEGLLCIDAATASSACTRDATGCCQPLCEFVEGQDGGCPNADQKCVQWYDPREPIPAGYEDVGVCAIEL